MTTKMQRGLHPDTAYQQFLDTCLSRPGNPGRRWNLLARQQNLPDELRLALDDFQTWSGAVWREATEDREGFLVGREPLNPLSVGWAWYRFGGAWTVLHARRLPTDDLPYFIALAQFVSNLGVSAGDTRRLCARMSLQSRSRYRRATLLRVRSCGTRHAAWWLASRAQNTGEPRLWDALEQRELTCSEPVRLLDVAAGEWARIRGRAH